MFTQKGGLGIANGYTPKEAFDYFISNSYIEVLTYSGAGGILFKSELKPDIQSPYISSRSNNPNQPVKFLLFKLCFLNRLSKNFVIYDNSGIDQWEHKPIDIMGTTAAEFISEIEIQLDVFNKSIDKFLEPICPGIVHAWIYRSEIDKRSFLNHFLTPAYISGATPRQNRDVKEEIMEPDLPPIEQNKLRFILKKVLDDDLFRSQYMARPENQTGTPPWFQWGLFAMESLENFVTYRQAAYNNVGVTQLKLYAELAMYELSRLYQIGYLHGDPNASNAMVNPDYKYIEGATGRVILIDFGLAYSIDDATSADGNVRAKVAAFRAALGNNSIILYSEEYYENFMDIMFSSTSPRRNNSIGINGQRITTRTWPGYQWLKSDREFGGHVYIENLPKISERRQKYKTKFEAHIQKATELNPNQPAPQGIFFKLQEQPLFGGGPKVLPRTKGQGHGYKYGNKYGNKYGKPSLLKIKYTYTPPPNIFDELDPYNIFTTNFVEGFVRESKSQTDGFYNYLKTIIPNTLLLDDSDVHPDPIIIYNNTDPIPEREFPYLYNGNTDGNRWIIPSLPTYADAVKSKQNFTLNIRNRNNPNHLGLPNIVTPLLGRALPRALGRGGNKTKTRKNKSKKTKKNKRRKNNKTR
jgi:hypothetical protein